MSLSHCVCVCTRLMVKMKYKKGAKITLVAEEGEDEEEQGGWRRREE